MSIEKKITKLLVNGLSHTPFIIIHMFATIIGLFFWLIPNKKRKLTYINLRICFPELPACNRNLLILKSLIEDVKTALETPAIMKMPGEKTDKLFRQTEGLEYIDHAFAANRSVIIAVPHFGNWEIIGQYLSRRYPMISLYRPQHRSSSTDILLKQGRERFGATLIPTDHTGIKALYRAIGEKKLIALLPDQYPGLGQGIKAPFFGRTAHTMTLLPKLAHKGKSVVLLVYSMRLPFGRGFSLHLEPIDCDFPNTSLEALAALFNQKMEQAISRVPEQYWWSYDRFRIMTALKPFTRK